MAGRQGSHLHPKDKMWIAQRASKFRRMRFKAADLLRAELCDNEVMDKGTAAATLPAPAPGPRQGSAADLETLPSSMETAEIPHSNQTSPIAGERQLSERSCVAEVSFCQTKVSEQSPSQLKAPLLQFSCSLVPPKGTRRNPKAHSKRKVSQKLMVKLVKLVFTGLLKNDSPLQKAFSCALADMN